MTDSFRKSPKPWFSILSFGSKTPLADNFYNPAQIEWTRELEKNWELIRDEASRFISQNENRIQSFYPDQQKWKSFGLYAWGVCLSKEKCAHFPQSLELIKKIPGVVTVMFGVMEPHSEIKGHYGDTDAIYRCHLGLIVPAHYPEIGIGVGDEKQGWQEGKTLLFNDGKFHYTWNKSDHRRVVLIIDVIKPEHLNKTIKICSVVLTSLTIQKIKQKLFFFPPFRILPVILLYPFIRVATFFYLRINKKSKNFLLY